MTGPPDPVAPNLTALVLTTKTLEAFLSTLAETSLALAPNCEGCGITLEREGHPLTVASAGSSAERLDEKQYGQNDGPCLEALRTGQEVAVREMRDERRWGGYPDYAVHAGIRSSLSLPIAPRTHTAGAINLYAPVPDAFADADLTSLRSLAAQATGAITLAQHLAGVPAFNEELQTVLSTRAVVDRATGIVMAQRNLSYDRALAHLRDTARRRDTPLHEVSAALVHRYGEPRNPDEPPAAP